MPACEVPELHVALFNAVLAGRQEEARRCFRALLPLLNLGSAYRTPITKHILVKRGVIGHARHRDGNPTLDPHDVAELDAVWSDLMRETQRAAA